MTHHQPLRRDEADYPRRARPHEMGTAPGCVLACHGGSSSASTQASTQTTQSTSGSTSPQTGNSSPQNNQGSQLTAGGNLTTTVDPVITGQAFQVVSDLVKQALNATAATTQTVSDANAQNNNALNSVLGTVLANDQKVASNTNSSGATSMQSFILWGLGIVVAAAVAFSAIFKKKS